MRDAQYSRMTLDGYLARHGITLDQLARQAGLAPSTLYRLVNGQLMPGRRTAAAIERATNGEVTLAGLAQSFGERRKAAA